MAARAFEAAFSLSILMIAQEFLPSTLCARTARITVDIDVAIRSARHVVPGRKFVLPSELPALAQQRCA